TNALALWISNGLFSGVSIHGTAAYVIGALVLAVANAVLKPILAILTLPLIIVTLGFFYLVINIAMVTLAERVAPNVWIDCFWNYVRVVFIVWSVKGAVSAFGDRTGGPRAQFG